MNEDVEYAAEMLYPNNIQQTWLCIWQYPSFTEYPEHIIKKTKCCYQHDLQNFKHRMVIL